MPTDEQWKRIKEAPDYAISSMGRVKRVEPVRGARVGTLLKPYYHRGRLKTQLRVQGIRKDFYTNDLVKRYFGNT